MGLIPGLILGETLSHSYALRNPQGTSCQSACGPRDGRPGGASHTSSLTH
jgi:hypothetical protein